MLTDHDEDLEQQEKESPVISQLRKDREEALKKAQDAEAALAEERRKSAITTTSLTLGIPDTDRERFAKLADKMIDGEPNEESLRALATEYGFGSQAQARAVQDATTARSIAAEHVGATTPITNSDAEIERKIAEAKSAQEVMEIVRSAGLPAR